MLEPWNNRSILRPAINTTPCKNFESKNLKNTCNTIIHILSKQSSLHKESAIFSRFLYKFDKKFRNDIGYRYYKKVNTALHSYLKLPLVKDINNFIDVLPNEHENFAPSKQLLEYVLIRLMTFSKVMHRVTICSKQAAIFYFNRIKRGESHWMCLMPFALLSRVWSMALVLLQHSCNWYNQLYLFLNKLKYKGIQFLPDKYLLPLNLEDWIDLKNLNRAGKFVWSQKCTTNFNSIVDEDDDEALFKNILKFVDNINKRTKHIELDSQLLLPKQEACTEVVHKQNNSDQGEAISRESFKKFTCDLPASTVKTSVNKEQVLKGHCIENITDLDSLNNFINNEEEYRNTSSDKSLTSHLTFMQWQSLKNILLKLGRSRNNKKMELKVQKLWKKKCLDYM